MDVGIWVKYTARVHSSPNSLNIVFSEELFDSATAFSPGGRRSSVGSPLNTPIRPFVWFLNVSGAPTVMSSCSALTPIVSENPASTNTFALRVNRNPQQSMLCWYKCHKFYLQLLLSSLPWF